MLGRVHVLLSMHASSAQLLPGYHTCDWYVFSCHCIGGSIVNHFVSVRISVSHVTAYSNPVLHGNRVCLEKRDFVNITDHVTTI